MIGQVIERLRARNATAKLFALVAGAAELGEIAGDRPPTSFPVVYVVPLAEDVVNLDHPGWTEDVVTIQFGTVTITQEKSDSRGGAATLAIGGLRQMVRQALSGWLPTGADEAVRYIGGRLMDFTDGRLWWQDNWAVVVRLNSEES